MEQTKVGDHYFDAVMKVLKENISAADIPQNEKLFFESLAVGGVTAASHVVTYCEEMKRLYGQGDAEKALSLSRLFTLLMLVQSFQWLKEHDQLPADSDQSSRFAAASVLSLFGGEDQKSIEIFSCLKTQFDYDVVNNPSMVHVGSFLLGWAAEAMGYPCFNWEKIPYPIDSMTEVTQAGFLTNSEPMRNPNDIKALWACHNVGCKALMGNYEAKDSGSNSATTDTGSD